MAEMPRHAYQFVGDVCHEQTLFDPIEPPIYPFLSKCTGDTEQLNQVFSADPELFVIALVRDPRSVITRKDTSAGAQEYSVGFERWQQSMEAIEQLSPKVRWLQVRYETLLADPASVQEQLEARFGFLRREESFATFTYKSVSEPEDNATAQASSHSLSPAFTAEPDNSTAHALQEHLPRLKRELEEHPGLVEWLVATGYEADDSWTKILENVEPAAASRESQAGKYARTLEFWARRWWRARRYLAQRSKLGAIY